MAGWPEELCLRLIELYKQNELLWNPNLKEYMKKDLKEGAWRNISAEIGRTPEECKSKIENLKGSYRRERRKVVKTTTRQGANEVYVSKWFAFQAFEFLKDTSKVRTTLNSEDSTSITLAAKDPNSENVDDLGILQGDSSTNNICFISPPVTPEQNYITHKKMKMDEHSAMIIGAYDILKTVAEKLKAPPTAMDETTLFFNYVSAKVQNYSSETKKGVQHAIFEILMKADTGYYEYNDYHDRYAYHPIYSDSRYSQSYKPPPTNRPFIPPSSRVSPGLYLSPVQSPSPAQSPCSISSTGSSPSPVNTALNVSTSSD